MNATDLRPVVGATLEQARENMKTLMQWVDAQTANGVFSFRRAIRRDFGDGRYAFFLNCQLAGNQCFRIEVHMPGCAAKTLLSMAASAPRLVVDGQVYTWMDAVATIAAALLLSEEIL